MYIVLFYICIYVLCHQDRPGKAILLGTAIAMFVLSTVETILNLVLGAADVDESVSIPYDQINNASGFIFVTNK